MKRHRTELTFAPLRFREGYFLSHLLKFEGLPSSENVTYAERVGESYEGSANCLGLILLAVRDMGLWHGDPNLPPTHYDGQSVAKTVAEIIEYNFREVETYRPGDLIVLKLASQHVAVVTSLKSNETPARYFHVSQEDRRARFDSFDAMTEAKIERVLRFKNMVL